MLAGVKQKMILIGLVEKCDNKSHCKLNKIKTKLGYREKIQ